MTSTFILIQCLEGVVQTFVVNPMLQGGYQGSTVLVHVYSPPDVRIFFSSRLCSSSLRPGPRQALASTQQAGMDADDLLVFEPHAPTPAHCH